MPLRKADRIAIGGLILLVLIALPFTPHPVRAASNPAATPNPAALATAKSGATSDPILAANDDATALNPEEDEGADDEELESSDDVEGGLSEQAPAEKEKKVEKKGKKEKYEEKKVAQQAQKAIEKAEKERQKVEERLTKALEKRARALEKALAAVQGTPAETVIRRLVDITEAELDGLLALLTAESGRAPNTASPESASPTERPESAQGTAPASDTSATPSAGTTDDGQAIEAALKTLDDDLLDGILTQTILLTYAERTAKAQAKALEEIAHLYERWGKKAAAIRALEARVALDPTDRDAYRDLGHLLQVGEADQVAIHLYVNGTPVSDEVPPLIKAGRTLVPIRTIAAALGISVDWNPVSRTVTLKNGERTVRLTIGHPTAEIDDQTVSLDVPPEIIQGRTLVPVRFVAEALGASVDWVPEGRLVAVIRL